MPRDWIGSGGWLCKRSRARHVFGHLQVGTGPWRSPSACSEMLKTKKEIRAGLGVPALDARRVFPDQTNRLNTRIGWNIRSNTRPNIRRNRRWDSRLNGRCGTVDVELSMEHSTEHSTEHSMEHSMEHFRQHLMKQSARPAVHRSTDHSLMN